MSSSSEERYSYMPLAVRRYRSERSASPPPYKRYRAVEDSNPSSNPSSTYHNNSTTTLSRPIPIAQPSRPTWSPLVISPVSPPFGAHDDLHRLSIRLPPLRAALSVSPRDGERSDAPLDALSYVGAVDKLEDEGLTYTSTPSPAPRTPPPQHETSSDVMLLEQIEGEDTYSISTNPSPVVARLVELPSLKERVEEVRVEWNRGDRVVHGHGHGHGHDVGVVDENERRQRQGHDGGPGTGPLPRSPASPTLFGASVVSGNDKPYKCTLCPKSFTRNYDLTRHKSSHQDARQHVCAHCGRSFNRRDALTRHNVIRGCGQARGHQVQGQQRFGGASGTGVPTTQVSTVFAQRA